MTRAELAALIYPVPQPYDSAEQHVRYVHADLADRTRAELLRERERIRLRLVLDDAPPAWVLERLARLEKASRDAR